MGLGVEVGEIGMRGGQLCHPVSMPRSEPDVEAHACGVAPPQVGTTMTWQDAVLVT